MKHNTENKLQELKLEVLSSVFDELMCTNHLFWNFFRHVNEAYPDFAREYLINKLRNDCSEKDILEEIEYYVDSDEEPLTKPIDSDKPRVNIDELKDYQSNIKIGENFIVVDKENDVEYEIHPFCYEDEYFIKDEALGGFDVSVIKDKKMFIETIEPDELTKEKLRDIWY